MGLRFDESRISDQKRLARGEHWLRARTLLRRRDWSHHEHWRVLMMAGGSPRGEIEAIRAVMPKAHIVAADTDASCLSAALECGANDTFFGDVMGNIKIPSKAGTSNYAVPSILERHEKFDAINLDLCGPVTDRLAVAVGRYMHSALTTQGVLMVTFSYGRDVVEFFLGMAWQRKFTVHLGGRPEKIQTRELPPEISDSLAGRIIYLGHLKSIESIVAYKGNEMPMCSVLYQAGTNKASLRIRRPSFIKLEPEDLGLAVVYPEVASLYDVPAERIQAFRNHFAALKAVATRKAKQQLNFQDPEPEDPNP